MIPVFSTKKVNGWPKSLHAKRWPYLDVATAFTTQHETDAHFAAYAAPEQPYRLTTEAFSAIPGGVPMVLGVFDVDAPGHGAIGDIDTWWLGELAKVRALLEQHPGAYVYRTRGGYRIVYALDVVIRDAADRGAWKLRYCTWAAYLRRAFGIRADFACKDATRLFRLPFVRRDGIAERRETIGDPASLGTWSCAPSKEDETEGARHAKVRPARGHKPREERPAASIASGEGVLFHAFGARGWVGRDLGGKYTLRCPWAHEHTGGRDHDSSTVLFAPSPGEAFGFPHCSHAHCSTRTLADWVALLEDDELRVARESAGLSADAEVVDAPADDDARVPTIVLSTDERRVNDEAIAAIAMQPDLYSRSGALTEVVHVDGRLAMRALPLPRVREVVASSARYVELRRDAESGELVEVPIHVPDWTVRAVHARGAWPSIPTLRGIVDAPSLRADGSVIQAPGFDAVSGFLFAPSQEYPPVPESPSQRDAVRAAQQLCAIVKDFPFEREEHRAAWLAFLLSLIARPAYDGPSPLIAIDANVRGAGKGRLCDATAFIATGRPASKTPQPKDDDEMRKRITAVLREGERIEVIDNVSRPLDDGSLDALLTSAVWKDRLLGANATLALPNLTVWVATGNNLAFGADTARRTLHIRLRSPHENPEDRDDIEQSDLLGYVAARRAELAVAALTILRAFFVAGRPNTGVRPWGSYEGWSALVASAVVFAGLPDPQSTRTRLEATADTAKANLVVLIEGWARLTRETPDGLTARDAIALLYPAERLRGQATYDDGHNALREAIEAMVATAPGKAPSSTKLGYRLRHFRGRVVRGRSLDSGVDRTGVARWRVVGAQVRENSSAGAGDAGDEGDVSNPSRAGTDTFMNTHGVTGVGAEHPRHAQHPLQSEVAQ